MIATGLRGVCAAVLTPLTSDLRPDAQKAIPYYRDLLDQGCDALNVLGTTGEAMSLSVADRLAFMEAVASSGLPRHQMMVGTGASALGDAQTITAAAFRMGFAAALVMPPFFFRDVTDDGVVRYFDKVIEAAQPPPLGIYLYNYPNMSGVRFHPELVDRLMTEFPGVIGGIKDSSNDTALQETLADAHSDLAVFPSSEAYLTKARQADFAGCISGSVALWPKLAADVWRGDEAQQQRLTALRSSLAGIPLIPAVRRMTAERSGDPTWERCIPPLEPLTNEELQMLKSSTEGLL